MTNIESLKNDIETKCDELEQYFIEKEIFVYKDAEADRKKIIHFNFLYQHEGAKELKINVELDFLLIKTIEKLKAENKETKLPIWIFEKIKVELKDFLYLFDSNSIKLYNSNKDRRIYVEADLLNPNGNWHEELREEK